MPNFNKNRGFNMKSKGNFDFGNKGIYDIKTETKDQSVVEADKPQKKSIFELTKEGKEKIMASDANPKFKKAIANSPIDMYGGKKGPMAKKYKNAAQRKAVHASKAEKGSMAKMYGKKSAMKNYKKGYYGA